MNYDAHYQKLMLRAQLRTPPTGVPLESHHICPTAMGGSDDASNLVLLTIHEHVVAHLLLVAMGNEDQIFSVECFYADALNRNRIGRYRHPKLRWKRWVRKAVAYRRAHNYRERMRHRLMLCEQAMLVAQQEYINAEVNYYTTAFNMQSAL